MKLPATLVPALLAVLAVAVQARPDGAAPEPDAPSTPPPAADSSSASHEADVDNSSSAEDDNMTVQGKAAALCPPRQPELLALEALCAQDEHPACSSTTAPVVELAETTEASAAAATTTEAAAAAASAGTTESPAPAPTESAPHKQRRQRKRSCNYHLCVLKKLEVLDSSDMPDKTLLTNWIANNVTDENQREKLQQKFTECVSSLKDVFGDASENSSSEEDTADEKKNEETQPKKKSCVAAKRVISCLSKSVECPVLKF